MPSLQPRVLRLSLIESGDVRVSASGFDSLDNFATPKSRTLACPRLVYEDICGLNVAVDNALRMRCIECVGNLDSQRKNRFHVHRAIAELAAFVLFNLVSFSS